MSKLVIRQYKSAIGAKESARETLASLGLRRPGNVVVREDSPSLRGQIRKIAHLVAVSEDRRKDKVDVESERRTPTSAGGALKDDSAKTRIGATER